ncbi:MAG: exo-alpha-sialidase [Planctomycetaceae bacterium]|nr:exo-alpha-sialidase [Planctomycetaceae bacterium]
MRDRPTTSKLVRVIAGLGFCLMTATSVNGQELWDASRKLPSSSELADIEGVQFHVIKAHQPERDQFDWLHGIALAWHGDRLFASYGHNTGRENTATEVANFSISSDGGQTWSPPVLIDDGQEPELAVSHGVFLEAGGRLWAFHGAFTGRMQNVHTRAYSFDENTQQFTSHGVVINDGFWPMQEPQRMSDGHWIMAGLRVMDGIGKPNNPAAVAISRGDDLLSWDLVTIPRSPETAMWGESAIVVRGQTVTNISRYGRPVALMSTSSDFGRTWSEMRASNLPMAASKPYAGTLSTGQNYLIANTTADGQNRRSPLTIAVSEPGGDRFVRVFRIRDAVFSGPGESHSKAALSYPYAVEREGFLYVAFSNSGGRGANRNSAELAVIPVESLQVADSDRKAENRTDLNSPKTGIAAEYPGDRGIHNDRRVIFAENFEASDIDAIAKRWDTVRDREIMTLSNEVPDGSSGRQSLLMTQLAEKGTGGDLYRVLGDGHDQLFTRMYVRFADDCEPIHHFGTCVGGNHPATPWPSVKAGQPTDGDRSFWIGIEPFGAKWQWDYYAYWCEMRGSPPRGQTWGNSFIHNDELRVRRGKWTCIEVMVRMNDVGDTNGELALWIDGQQVSHLGKGFPSGKWTFDKFQPGRDGEGVRWNSEKGDREYFTTAAGGDPFEGFRFRTSPPLNINYLWLYTYITKGTIGHANRVWFDDVVVATEYIGPLSSPSGSTGQ